MSHFPPEVEAPLKAAGVYNEDEPLDEMQRMAQVQRLLNGGQAPPQQNPLMGIAQQIMRSRPPVQDTGMGVEPAMNLLGRMKKALPARDPKTGRFVKESKNFSMKRVERPKEQYSVPPLFGGRESVTGIPSELMRGGGMMAGPGLIMKAMEALNQLQGKSTIGQKIGQFNMDERVKRNPGLPDRALEALSGMRKE